LRNEWQCHSSLHKVAKNKSDHEWACQNMDKKATWKWNGNLHIHKWIMFGGQDLRRESPNRLSQFSIQIRFTLCTMTNAFQKWQGFLLVIVFGGLTMTARNPKSSFLTILSHVCKTTCILGCKTKYTWILSDPIHLDQIF
jgi:hypothetical protein